MRGLSALAILLGGVSDVVLSGILGVPLVLYVVATRGLTRLSGVELESAVTAALRDSPALYAVQVSIGLGCSILGGFVAALIAKQRHLLNAVLAAWLCVAIGVYSLVAGVGASSVPLQLGSIAVTPLCYLLGAQLRLTISRSRRSP